MALLCPHLHTFSTLRSSGLLHPQYRFIPLHCIPAVFVSATPGGFSGCSFAPPSGLAPFREKRHCALNQGTPKADFKCFPAVTRSQYYSPLRLVKKDETTFRSRPAVAVRLPQHRHVAPHLVFAKATTRLRCLGVFP